MAPPRKYERMAVWVPPKLTRFLDSVAMATGKPRDRAAGYLLCLGAACQCGHDGDTAMRDELVGWAEELFRRGDLDQ